MFYINSYSVYFGKSFYSCLLLWSLRGLYIYIFLINLNFCFCLKGIMTLHTSYSIFKIVKCRFICTKKREYRVIRFQRSGECFTSYRSVSIKWSSAHQVLSNQTLSTIYSLYHKQPNHKSSKIEGQTKHKVGLTSVETGSLQN